MHSDVATSRFTQLVRMPSRIYSRGELEKNQTGFNLTSPKTFYNNIHYKSFIVIRQYRPHNTCLQDILQVKGEHRYFDAINY